LQNSKFKPKNRITEDENNISFDQKFYQDIDTSELVKRRQKNEAYLEEIEKTIMDNIESSKSIIDKNKEMTERVKDDSQEHKSTFLLNYNKRKYNIQESGNNKNKFNYHKIVKKTK